MEHSWLQGLQEVQPFFLPTAEFRSTAPHWWGTANPAARVPHTRAARTSRPYQPPGHVSVGFVCEYQPDRAKIDVVRAHGAHESAPGRSIFLPISQKVPRPPSTAPNAEKPSFPHALFVRRATASEGFARPVLALGHHKGCRRRPRAAWAPPRWRRNSDELAFEACMIRASSTASAVAARPTRR